MEARERAIKRGEHVKDSKYSAADVIGATIIKKKLDDLSKPEAVEHEWNEIDTDKMMDINLKRKR